MVSNTTRGFHMKTGCPLQLGNAMEHRLVTITWDLFFICAKQVPLNDYITRFMECLTQLEFLRPVYQAMLFTAGLTDLIKIELELR